MTRIGFGLAAAGVAVATVVAAMLHLAEVGLQVLVKAHIVGLG